MMKKQVVTEDPSEAATPAELRLGSSARQDT